MQVLGTDVNKGGVILLISDGEENEAPYVSQVMPQLIASQARVVSMAFGQNAAKLIEDLAEQTDGKSYFINDDVTMSGLNSAFDDSLTYQPVVTTGNIVVKVWPRLFQNWS
jgi:calcium-activated chloride channel regulator 3/4